MVRATFKTRWLARAERCNCRVENGIDVASLPAAGCDCTYHRTVQLFGILSGTVEIQRAKRLVVLPPQCVLDTSGDCRVCGGLVPHLWIGSGLPRHTDKVCASGVGAQLTESAESCAEIGCCGDMCETIATGDNIDSVGGGKVPIKWDWPREPFKV